MKKSITKKWIIRLFKPFIKNILMMTIFTIIVIICGFISPFLTKNLVDNGILSNNIGNVVYYLSLFALVYAIQYLSEFLQFIFYKPICTELPNELNELAWSHILKIELKYFKEKNFSQILSENMQDISNIISLIDIQFLTSIITLIKIIAGFCALFYISPKLMILLLVISPLKLIVNSKFYNKRININKSLLNEQTKFSKWIGDCVSGIYEIKMWNLVDEKKLELKKILDVFKHIRLKLLNYGFLEAILGSTLLLIANLGIYFLGALFIFKNQLTIGGLLAFITYSSFIFEPLEIVSGLFNKFASVNPSLQRFDSFMTTGTEKDVLDGIDVSDDFSLKNIQFKNVSFGYEKVGAKVLNNINFSLKKNEVIGIVGENGCGKSTIINLLTRFYQQDEGEILINNININQFKLDEYRKIIGVMSQKSYIFNDSIKNNINITKQLTDDEIVFYSNLSGLTNSMINIDENYEYIVGFDGQKLSGGQRQKLAMARTLSKKGAKILILDEATSHYDIHSSYTVIEEIIKSNTFEIIIIISHQPEILKKLDRLIFLKDGAVKGDGNYYKLIENEEFSQMVKKHNG